MQYTCPQQNELSAARPQNVLHDTRRGDVFAERNVNSLEERIVEPVDTSSGATSQASAPTQHASTHDIVNNKTGVPLSQYRSSYAALTPETIADRCQIPYKDNAFTLVLLQQEISVSYPAGIARYVDTKEELDDEKTILMLRYLTEGAKAPWNNTFIAYAEMPWGETYLQQFTGRCINRLAASYGNNLDEFTQSAITIGGKSSGEGDAASIVPFMENLLVKLIVWAADDEFPASAQILFSENFKTAFTAEDLAHVGDIILNAMKPAR